MNLKSTSAKSSIQQDKPSDWFQRIAIVRTDVQRDYFPTEEAYIAENECILRSEEVALLIKELGIKVKIFPADAQLSNNLVAFKPQLCINFVDTVRGFGALAAGIPGIFDTLGLAYVGAGTLSLALNSNKFLTKTLLENWDIPTPRYQLLRTVGQEIDYDLRYPLIVKLNEEHGSVGIESTSVVTNETQLKSQVRRLIKLYQQPVLVEEFIDNAIELTAVVVESSKRKIFLSERVYDTPSNSDFKLLTFNTKWATDLGLPEPVTYAPVSIKNEKFVQAVKRTVRTAFDVLRMDDIARFDIMVDKYLGFYIVDANANPSLGPNSSVAFTALANQTPFKTILIDLLKRNHLDVSSA